MGSAMYSKVLYSRYVHRIAEAGTSVRACRVGKIHGWFQRAGTFRRVWLVSSRHRRVGWCAVPAASL